MGWLPNYIDSRAKGLRPTRGYESIPARKMRLFHRCWIEFLDGWAERTRDATNLTWADGVERSTRIFLGGLLGDQQEGDKFTAEPCVCQTATAALQHVKTTLNPMRLLKSNRQSACGSRLKQLQLAHICQELATSVSSSGTQTGAMCGLDQVPGIALYYK